MFSSESLEVGSIYTRADLMELFGITDATINTEIFQPSGHESVWLFVTEDKTPDRTRYEDMLNGNDLEWDSQPSGRKDDLIVHHRDLGLEVLLFYRKKKYEFPGAGFRYEGPFDYVSHAGSGPAHFKLRRSGGRRYWALLANPEKYRIEAVVRALDEDTWVLPTGTPNPGDRLVVWKAKGATANRGVVALAEVLEGAHVQPPHPR